MKPILIILNLIIMCTFFSCLKKPTACFKVVSENSIAGQPVQFQNCSDFGRGDAYWDFGDSTDIGRNPMPDIQHTFEKAGEYEVTLKVVLGKHSDEVSHLITIEN